LVACVIAWIQIGKERKTAWIGKGIKDALPIVLITGMGGAFGQVLKMSTLISNVTDLFASSGGSAAYLLLIGFATALIIKTAQGSSTAAIVISSSLIFPLTGELTAWQTALLISAIGSGAMAVSHANDSYFWVVSRFSGMTVRQSYKYFSLLTLLLAATGILTCLGLLQLI
jgi:GntP family gluconate:H+ symporter